ncbi:MAG: hypothetical protein U0R52_07320 [Solirubrobacterales bacterium]
MPGRGGVGRFPAAFALLGALALPMPPAAAARDTPVAEPTPAAEPTPTAEPNPAAGATPAAGPTPAAALIRAYSPILMLRSQQDPPCDDAEEQYQPMPVDVVLGNPRVVLKLYNGGRSKPVVRAPTAAEIAGRDENHYLDLPGDPLEAGCTYARDFAALRREGRAPAVTYAHIAREPGHPGFVVQYWFFWYFNQFNDVHEGDWEGMQIAFDSANAAGALREGPSKVAVFQHGGGETVGWGDSEVERQGTHPVVYPAAGSHATFFESAVFVENGQGGAGLGCDNTSEPLRRLRPDPVQIPTYPAVGSPAQWLTYEGHWGQREKGFNTGPTGPNTKTQWTQPFTWMDGLRTASPKLPGGALLGPAVTSAFCGTVAEVSKLVNLEARSRLGLALVLLVAAAIVVVPALLTRWRPVDLEPLRQRRALGQLLRAARQIYGRHWRAMVPLGLTALPVLGAVYGASELTGALFGDGQIGGSVGGAGLQTAPAADTLQTFAQPVGYAIVGGAVIGYLRLLDEGAETGFVAAYRLLLGRFWRVVGTQLLVVLMLIGLVLTVIGIPIAARKVVDWLFVQQEVLFRDRSVRDAVRASSDTVRGSWWWALRVALVLWVLSLVVGPVLTFALIFANLSLPLINLIGSVIFALLIPYLAIAGTLLFFDLEERIAVSGPVPRGRWKRSLPWRQPGTAPDPAAR